MDFTESQSLCLLADIARCGEQIKLLEKQRLGMVRKYLEASGCKITNSGCGQFPRYWDVDGDTWTECVDTAFRIRKLRQS